MSKEFVNLVENTINNDRILNSLDSNSWYHNSSIEPQKFQFIEATNQQKIHQKPKGLWIAKGKEWFDIVSQMGTDSIKAGPYIYKVDIIEDYTVVLESEKQVMDFNFQYKINKVGNDLNMFIDWPKVAKNFAGILIPDFDPTLAERFEWYYTWDLSSGCYWRDWPIKKIEFVDKLEL